ncbi:CDF family heavy metal/H(+) antiporter [Alishewanella jeotgali KCTC 22429]|uniref:CDF family heavy metal/H(+) antiporter n=1 Tax=Alishewanella jeotgali KCTC 22429 TaxID=1129374 RepID=H3ZI96_9ALTE|nr:CDF family heavy metal/H(+) antiporter [Alishewanella jeotgali KCTC 22429]
MQPEQEPVTKAASHDAKWHSLYHIPKMDCPSEERLIRLALQDLDGIVQLEFDLAQRQLAILHQGDATMITKKLQSLGLGAQLSISRAASVADRQSFTADPAAERRTLYWLLAINAMMFVLEFAVGIVAQSMALLADSLDMFADAAVYLLALFAVGKGLQLQLRAAKVAGWLQAILALGVLAEVVRRALYGSEPQSTLMLGMASLALVANVSCLVLLAKHRQGGAHMKASWIFSANDVLINFGVILGALLVAWTGSAYPDLLVGAVVGAIVLLGAKRILALRR